MKRLIVNADDFGRTHGINTGVMEAHLRGIVTSATAMVTYESVAEAAELSRRNPSLGVGLHLALTGGRPALPPPSIPTLVDAKGLQPLKPEGLGGADDRELAAEAEAQLAKFMEIFGRSPTHIDSHHHSHRRPAVFEVVCALARRERIPVRNAGEPMGRELKARGLRANDFFEERFFDEGATVPDLLGIIDGLPEGSTELMCHPGHEDPVLAATSSYAEARVRELAALTDPAVRAAIERAGVRLISFAQL